MAEVCSSGRDLTSFKRRLRLWLLTHWPTQLFFLWQFFLWEDLIGASAIQDPVPCSNLKMSSGLDCTSPRLLVFQHRVSVEASLSIIRVLSYVSVKSTDTFSSHINPRVVAFFALGNTHRILKLNISCLPHYAVFSLPGSLKQLAGQLIPWQRHLGFPGKGHRAWEGLLMLLIDPNQREW